MAKTAVTDWDIVAANNTEINNIGLSDSMTPDSIDNALREMMAQLATNDRRNGTWTPDLRFNGATTGITYGSRGGVWRRPCDKVVHVSGFFILTSKGSATGAAAIFGLPYTPADISFIGLSGYNNMSSFQISYGFTSTSGWIELHIQGGVTNAGATNTNFTNTSNVYFSGTYVCTA